MDLDSGQNPFSGVEPSTGLEQQAPEALRHLLASVRSGVPWHRALLETIGLWTQPLEEYQDRTYRYLIQGEAFDWLVLAERLCAELDGVIPGTEKEPLLFSGRLPESIGPEVFRGLLGASKYRAYLNYWYGVIVEEALQLSVEEDVRKRHLARCYADSEDLVEEAFVHLYGATRSDLVDEFRQQTHVPRRRSLSLSNLKELTYWLHKRRLKMWDPARVASDTKKGITRLRLLEESCSAGQAPDGV